MYRELGSFGPFSWGLSSNMTVRYEGLDELIVDMNKMSKELFDEVVKSTIRLHGGEMQRTAKTYCPVDTGALRKSIDLTISDGGFTAEVEPGMHYRVYVEYGTRYMPPQPYMRPAFYEQEPNFKDDMDDIAKTIMGK